MFYATAALSTHSAVTGVSELLARTRITRINELTFIFLCQNKHL
ncbi:unnamed protein product [Oikopleura dioica]|uniref:Uncharacterized protein n=1 Tax=Oikopleura dioica TaxID=34765 RepID=E4XC26_OIKDI|nr:unnamed protein product [Oikopleura dioica]